ncbi:MAG TPA: SH3 domain-containing protein [Thermomicrobiales bacterium]|nr:SH3 domain-containing protein [Thermomicrobiales bacterium]HRA48531.1 SH3 domain-containing protein [Thermomicrobiales bacterium]
MSDPGLTRRLRQQSHRSGLAVGISMALAIGVCVVAFTFLYVKLDPWVRDFSGSEPAPTATARQSASNNPDDEPTEEPTRRPRATATEDTGGSDSGNVSESDSNGSFDPDYQVTALEAVNFRSGPGTSFDIVAQLDPGTQIQYLDDREAATEPENAGTNWLKFRTENGDEGWIRDVDVGQT